MLRSSLKSLSNMHIDNEVETILAMAGIKETARAENLSRADFIRLTECYLRRKGMAGDIK